MSARIIAVYSFGDEADLGEIPADKTAQQVADEMMSGRGILPAWLRLRRAVIAPDGTVRLYVDFVLSRAAFSPRFWWAVIIDLGRRLCDWWKGDRP